MENDNPKSQPASKVEARVPKGYVRGRTAMIGKRFGYKAARRLEELDDNDAVNDQAGEHEEE